METRSLHHVSVWLDDLSPSDEGAFTEALEWAWRLSLPFRAVVRSTRLANHDPGRHVQAHGNHESTPIVEKVKKWGIACGQRGVTMETSFWVGETDVGIDQFLRPWGLCVFEENRSDPVREKLLARSTRNAEVLLLLTPPVYKPMTRFLIIQHHENPNPSFLQTAARLCLALEVQPLVLTMASSERQARLKESFAEGVCSSLRVQANFDSVVAFDFRTAVERVAAWRNCSHVIVERPRNVSLWQRLRVDVFWQHLRGDVFSELRGLSSSVALLGLPESAALEVPDKMRHNCSDNSRCDPSPIANRLA
jgi:hypothetical protein